MLRLALATFLLALLMPSSTPAAEFDEGTHYTIVAERPTAEPVVMEFFSYGCDACYQFDAYFQRAKNILGDQATFMYVPADFGGGFWTPTQDLFLVLDALGKREELHTAAFVWFHGQPRRTPRESNVKEFLAQHGIDETTFERTRRSFAVHVNEKRHDQLTRQFRIANTPTIIVNGRYQVERRALRSADDFVRLVRYLLRNP